MVENIKGSEIRNKEFIDHGIGEGQTVEISTIVDGKRIIIFRYTVPARKHLQFQAEWHEEDVFINEVKD